MTSEISNSADIIDSRDIIERIEELDAKAEAIADAQEALEACENDEEREELQEELDSAEADFDDDERHEWTALKALAEEAEGYASDWKYGETLIRETYFVDYCQELLQDIGDLPKDIPHYIVIDWQATAENLRADYTEVDFDGVAYLVR